MGGMAGVKKSCVLTVSTGPRSLSRAETRRRYADGSDGTDEQL